MYMTVKDATLIAKKIQKNSRSTALASIRQSSFSASVRDGSRPAEARAGTRDLAAGGLTGVVDPGPLRRGPGGDPGARFSKLPKAFQSFS